MPKPACVACQRFFRPYRNGVDVLEQKPIGNRALPGNLTPDEWEPYKVWHADAWKCDGCDTVIITGYGCAPRWQDYETIQMPEPKYTINDC